MVFRAQKQLSESFCGGAPTFVGDVGAHSLAPGKQLLQSSLGHLGGHFSDCVYPTSDPPGPFSLPLSAVYRLLQAQLPTCLVCPGHQAVTKATLRCSID